MHQAAREWVARHAGGKRVVEIGGRDINGTVRDLFRGSDYVAIDVQEGPGVDEVCDFLDYTPARKPDTVVCCEVFEHFEDWPKLVAHAADMLKVGGRFIVTAAGPKRAPHSAIDGADVRKGEFYRNVKPADLETELSKHFKDVTVEEWNDDVRAVATKGRKK